MITFSVLAGIFLSGSILVVLGLRNAPEGHEDENGFHYVWRNDRPEAADISCIWMESAPAY